MVLLGRWDGGAALVGQTDRQTDEQTDRQEDGLIFGRFSISKPRNERTFIDVKILKAALSVQNVPES